MFKGGVVKGAKRSLDIELSLKSPWTNIFRLLKEMDNLVD